MSNFVINGKTYKAKEFNFNTLCDMDDYGVSLQDIAKKPMSFIRAYIALCMNATLEDAGSEIEGHLIGGGNLDDIYGVMNKELEESGFFRALQNEPKEVPTNTPKTPRKTK